MNTHYMETLESIAYDVIRDSNKNIELAKEILDIGYPMSEENLTQFFRACRGLSATENSLYELNDLGVEYTDEDDEEYSISNYRDAIHSLIFKNIALEIAGTDLLDLYIHEYNYDDELHKIFYELINVLVIDLQNLVFSLHKLEEVIKNCPYDNDIEDDEEDFIKEKEYLNDFPIYKSLVKSIGFVAQKCIEANNNKEIESGFIKLMDALYSFGNGENIEPFSLSLVNQNSDSKGYIDFCFESNTIEISKGGYIFEDGMVGDSYSDWMCTFWNSGDISDYEDFDISEIKEMISEGTEVSLTLPDGDVIEVELSE